MAEPGADPKLPKQPANSTTYARAATAGGLTFLGPTVLYPLIEYAAQLGHLDPQPTGQQLVAAAAFVSGLAVFAISVYIRRRGGTAVIDNKEDDNAGA